MSAWRHEKTGDHYEIMGFAVEEKTCTPVVVYAKIGETALWTRPCVEFFDGRFKQVPRPKRKPGECQKPNFGRGHGPAVRTGGLDDFDDTQAVQPKQHPTGAGL